METENIKSAVEAILFAAGEPVPTARISLILEVSEDAVLAAAKSLPMNTASTGAAFEYLRWIISSRCARRLNMRRS